MGGCGGRLRWAAAGAAAVGGCGGRLRWVAAMGEKPPESASVASVAKWLGRSKKALYSEKPEN